MTQLYAFNMDTKFNLNTYTHALLNALPVFLAFAMPIFFLPLTLEFFEFNKLTLLIVSTILLLLTWIAKMLINKEVSIVKSAMDVPLLALAGVYILATVFSIDKVSSLFGSQGRWFPSLFGIVTLIAFYYVVSSNVRSEKVAKNVLIAFIGGTTVSTLISLLSYFGVVLGTAAHLQVPNFTLTGSVTTTAVIAAIASVLAVILMVHAETPSLKIMLVQAAIVNLFGALLLGNIAAYAALVFGVLSMLYFVPINKFTENKTLISVTLGAAAVTVMVLITPTTREAILNASYPKEISLSPRESWIVTSSIMRDFPALGTGPSTFYLNYPRYKSLLQNNTDFWNVRFDKPFSEFFGIIANLGILGVIIVTFFLVRATRVVVKNTTRDEGNDGVRTSLAIATLSLLVVMLFTYSTVLTGFLLFLFLALSISLAQDRSEGRVERIVLSLASFSESMSLVGGGTIGRKETFQYIATIPLLALAIAGGFFAYKNYAGEFYMRKAVEAAAVNNGTDTYRYQTRAINVNPQKAAYHDALARTNIALASAIASKEELTDPDRQSIQQLIAQAIRSVRLSTEALNPLNADSWETRAVVYSALTGVAEDAPTWSKSAYNTAIQLDPTNPRLRLLLGGLHFAEADYLTAANLYRQAIQLKNDYANGHYNYAQSLVALEAFDQARAEFEITARLVPAGSPDAQRVAQDLETLKNLPAVAGDSSSLPTVGELEGVNEEEVTEQEPLAPAQQLPETPALPEPTPTPAPTAGQSQDGTTPTQGNQPQENQ